MTEDSTSDYTFAMDDETQGWSISAELATPTGYTGEDKTAEVVTEATSECDSSGTCTVLPLTNFGSMTYTKASYNNGTYYTSSGTTQIVMYQNDAEADGWGHWEQTARSR